MLHRPCCILHNQWRRGVVISGVRRMNEVNARQARLGNFANCYTLVTYLFTYKARSPSNLADVECVQAAAAAKCRIQRRVSQLNCRQVRRRRTDNSPPSTSHLSHAVRTTQRVYQLIQWAAHIHSARPPGAQNIQHQIRPPTQLHLQVTVYQSSQPHTQDHPASLSARPVGQTQYYTFFTANEMN